MKMIRAKIIPRLVYMSRSALALFRYLRLKKPRADRARCIYVDIPNPNLERYYYLLLKFFDIAGFDVYIKANLKLLLNLRNHSERIYHIPNLRIRRLAPKHADLWLTDKQLENRSKRAITVDVDYFRQDKGPATFIWPFSMHPTIYDSDCYEAIDQLRTTTRTIRVFLGGNLSEAYELHDGFISGLFGKINRWRIACYLESFADENWMELINSPDKVKDVFRYDFRSKFVLVKGARFSLADWLRALAMSDFFVAAPGVIMPFSNNIIEAMAVGAVPILQYPELFNPPLKEMENCLCYSTEEELLSKIKAALRMDADTINLLRRNVISYYDRYLDPKAVVEQMIKAQPAVTRIYVNAGHLSVYKLRDSLESQRKKPLLSGGRAAGMK